MSYGPNIQGPQISAQQPETQTATMFAGAPRKKSFFESLLSAAGPIVGMFNPVAGAAIGAANSLVSGNAGGFAQSMAGTMGSQQESPAPKTQQYHEQQQQMTPAAPQTDTAVDTRQQQAPLMMQQQMPLWMYEDPMLELLQRMNGGAFMMNGIAGPMQENLRR